MLSLLPVLFCAGLITSSSLSASRAALLDSPYRHVRTTNGNVQRLLETGVRRSPTFASLLARLNASDVIVYIEQTTQMPQTLEGRLLLMPARQSSALPPHSDRARRVADRARGAHRARAAPRHRSGGSHRRPR